MSKLAHQFFDSLMSKGNDVVDSLPILGAFTTSSSEKALVQKQQELAAEAKRRYQQQQQAGMNTLGQTLLAFAPHNRLMAQMFGPEAAFTPEQFTQMVADPRGAPQVGAIDLPSTGGKPRNAAEADEMRRRAELSRYLANQQRWSDAFGASMAPGPGPAPIAPPQPMAPKRY